MNFEPTIDFARKMDQQDPLRSFRERFFIPQHEGKDCLYFTGNSLGLQPRSVASYLQQELDDWARLGVDGHFSAVNPWFSHHELFPPLLAPIVCALPKEIVVMNQLTVNLHLLLTSFYRPDKKRFRIICETRAFPSDQYAMESQVRLHGLDPKEAIIEVGPKEGSQVVALEDILRTIEQYADSTALVLFGGVNYYNGQVFDMKAITAAAHKAGAYCGFDLAHAAGNIELCLHDWEVDFACWCSYKYLNSGPGGVSGVYIHESHAANTSLPRLAGWWGHEKETRFRMEPGFRPIDSAEGWQLSNAPVLLMAAHKAALDIFKEAGMQALFTKSSLLTRYLFFLMANLNKEEHKAVVKVITPQGEKEHGCQVSILMLEQGRKVFDQLTKAGVIADWREPNVIRVAPVPLYNSFEDVWQFTQHMKTILES